MSRGKTSGISRCGECLPLPCWSSELSKTKNTGFRVLAFARKYYQQILKPARPAVDWFEIILRELPGGLVARPLPFSMRLAMQYPLVMHEYRRRSAVHINLDMGYLRTAQAHWRTDTAPVGPTTCAGVAGNAHQLPTCCRCHFTKKGLLHVAARVRSSAGMFLERPCAGERFLLRGSGRRPALSESQFFSRN